MCFISYSILAAPSFPLDGSIIQIPSIYHHQFEVPIIFEGHADVIVVLYKLVEGDDFVSTGDAWVEQRVVELEGVHEFNEYLFLSLLA
jgi:hypothetical protein